MLELSQRPTNAAALIGIILCFAACSAGTAENTSNPDEPVAVHDTLRSDTAITATDSLETSPTSEAYIFPDAVDYASFQGYTQHFYPIGFSLDGTHFAYIKINENGGCGTCNMQLRIQNLQTDEITHTLPLAQEVMEQDPRDVWESRYNEIHPFLKEHNIKQTMMPGGIHDGNTIAFGTEQVSIRLDSTKGPSDWRPDEEEAIKTFEVIAEHSNGSKPVTLHTAADVEYYDYEAVEVSGWNSGPNRMAYFVIAYWYHGYEGETTIDYMIVGCDLDVEHYR